MKRTPFVVAGLTLLAFTSTQASATCLAEIAQLSPGTTTGSGSDPATTASVQQGRVSKDGSHAPLQSTSNSSGQSAASSGSAQNTNTASGQGITKDGSTMPLAGKPGEGTTNVATSQQDAQAQQRGGQTAATAGQAGMSGQTSGYNSPEMMAALDQARTLAQRGDEAGCMQAVQEARRLKP